MGNIRVCDLCKKPTNEIAHKVLLTPVPRHGKSMQSEYTHHADIGICCQGRIKNIINFKARRTREQYNADRKKRSGFKASVERVSDGHAVAKGKAS
jgi:hypothetical protein